MLMYNWKHWDPVSLEKGQQSIAMVTYRQRQHSFMGHATEEGVG